MILKHDVDIGQEDEKAFSTLCKIPHYVFIVSTLIGMDSIGTPLVLRKFPYLDVLPLFPSIPMFA